MSAKPPLLRSPLHDRHVAAGAKLVEFAGWEMPVQYGGVIGEHRAVRSAAGLFDVSHMGEFLVTGPGAESFIQRLTPNDVAKLTPGRAHYSGLLTTDGTYVDDLLVYRLGEEEFLLVVNAANTQKDFEWVRTHLDGEVELADRSMDYALLALQGPRALDILQPLTETDLSTIRYYRFADGVVAGSPSLISRTGYTGEDGFELYLPPAEAAAVWDRLLEVGTPDGLVPAGLGARDTLRLEAGMALYGHEIDDTTTPWDAGLDWLVKLDKGDFVGRQALVAQKDAGTQRRLVGFEVEGRGIARQGHPVMDDGKRVGEVTSGTWSPTFEKALGMAYLPHSLAEPETELALEVRGKLLTARVVELPFYKRSK
ncbi:MAG: glycine cleavage system aminomethyltransferase GcvT [Thermoanaerobaculia bacterium]